MGDIKVVQPGEREGWSRVGERTQKIHTVLTQNKRDTHLFHSAHIPLIRTSHMVPNQLQERMGNEVSG